METSPSAGKHGTEKTRGSQVTIGFPFAPDWLKTQHVCSDWLDNNYRAFRMLSTINRKNCSIEMFRNVFIVKQQFRWGDNFCCSCCKLFFFCFQSKQGHSLVIPNISAILSDFQTIGEGLVKKIEVLNA